MVKENEIVKESTLWANVSFFRVCAINRTTTTIVHIGTHIFVP